ncbi:MAG: SOS response-associated peptidase family protein [Pseudomonadota bacterium]
MCVNYITVSRQICFDFFRTPLETGEEWRDEIYQDYAAPFIIREHGARVARLGSYGFIPQRRMPPGQRLTTMNARAETVGQLRTYKQAWAASQRCLVPCMAVFEPNWEQSQHVRWAIEMADQAPFAVAGLWRGWEEPDGALSHSFTQLTVNADDHPVMRRFHKPGDEKRSVAIVRPQDYDDWLACTDPDLARGMLQLYPAELLHARSAPRPSTKKQAELFE